MAEVPEQLLRARSSWALHGDPLNGVIKHGWKIPKVIGGFKYRKTTYKSINGRFIARKKLPISLVHCLLPCLITRGYTPVILGIYGE